MQQQLSRPTSVRNEEEVKIEHISDREGGKHVKRRNPLERERERRVSLHRPVLMLLSKLFLWFCLCIFYWKLKSSW